MGTDVVGQSKIKEAKTAVNVGLSLSADYKNINLTTAYETSIKKKFQSHQGSLKLRLNF